MLAAALLSASLAPQAWSIQAAQLRWQDVPQSGVGLRIPGDADVIRAAAAAGAAHLMIELPITGDGWKEAIQAAEQAEVRYWIAISTPSPRSSGWIIDPAGHRRPAQAPSSLQTAAIPQAAKALGLLSANRDTAILRHAEAAADAQGRIPLPLPATAEGASLVVYPYSPEACPADLWQGLSRWRDHLIRTLAQNPCGPGFRGLMNPLGADARWPEDRRIVPDSPLFQAELEAILASKHDGLSAAIDAWSLSANRLRSFADMSRLVPLWNDDGGPGALWDPKEKLIIPCDRSRSEAWEDISQAIRSAALRRTAHFTAAIRSACAGPLAQEWTSWFGPVESPDAGFDGAGYAADPADPARAVQNGLEAASTVLRWGRPGIILASDLQAPKGEAPLETLLAEAQTFGASWAFVRADSAAEAAALAPRVRAVSLEPETPSALFFPISARGLAEPGRIPGGGWWMPSPEPGFPVPLGRTLQGYRIQSRTGAELVLWTRSRPAEIRFRAFQPERLQFRSPEGLPSPARIRKEEASVALTPRPASSRDPGELPVPIEGFEEVSKAIQRILENGSASANPMGAEKFQFDRARAAFSQTPGASFTTLTVQLERLALQAAPYQWIEGERPAETNFSAGRDRLGASRGRVAVAECAIPTPAMVLRAAYAARAEADDQRSVWISGRFPADWKRRLVVLAQGQPLSPVGDPVLPYGEGLSWLAFRPVAIKAGPAPIEIRFLPARGARLEVDAVVLAGPDFIPEAGRPPMNWAYPDP
jgi:hypothetical protein